MIKRITLPRIDSLGLDGLLDFVNARLAPQLVPPQPLLLLLLLVLLLKLLMVLHWTPLHVLLLLLKVSLLKIRVPTAAITVSSAAAEPGRIPSSRVHHGDQTKTLKLLLDRK